MAEEHGEKMANVCSFLAPDLECLAVTVYSDRAEVKRLLKTELKASCFLLGAEGGAPTCHGHCFCCCNAYCPAVRQISSSEPISSYLVKS